MNFNNTPSPVHFIFIARQHAMHAERDIVLANLSVSLSVCPMPVLCLKEWAIVKHF